MAVPHEGVGMGCCVGSRVPVDLEDRKYAEGPMKSDETNARSRSIAVACGKLRWSVIKCQCWLDIASHSSVYHVIYTMHSSDR